MDETTKTPTKEKKHYLSGREIRQIAKENNKVIRVLEKKKRRKAAESEFLSEMKDDGNILEIENLHSYFFTDQGVVKAVNGVSFEIPQGATVGVVGESGCGKSVTSMSVMQLLQGPYGQICEGSIRFKSYDFKRDGNGEPIPIYEYDEAGNLLYEEKLGKREHAIPVWENDENGAPIYDVVKTRLVKRAVYEEIETTRTVKEPVYEDVEEEIEVKEPVLDKKGDPVKDENGDIVYGITKKTTTVCRQKTDENGKKMYADVQKKAIVRRQKTDENGVKLFVTEEEKVYRRRCKVDENGKPVYETTVDEKGRTVRKKGLLPVLGKDGKPVLVPKQKRDEYGTRQFEMEEKTYDIAQMPVKEMYRLRGRQIAMIFQEPMTSLNPVITIGNQLDEVTFLHFPGSSKQDAKRRSIEMLNLVGIAMPERVYRSYPHELSGGMRQRVMISMALAGNPRLIIADEPTTALDVTIQAQILDLLRDLKQRINGSILLITHDLGIIAEMADYVVVMYAGRIIERGTVSEIFHHPMHPYTIGLQKSKPTMDTESDALFNIPGNVPNPIDMPDYCYFRERCSGCVRACFGDYPPMVQVSPTHWVACHLYDEKKEDVK